MHARSFWATVLAACWPALCGAASDPTDTVQVSGTLSLIRDNNIFRLPDVDPQLFGINPDNKADTTFVKGIGLRLDKTISRQRLLADVNLRESTYQNNDNLDFFGGDGRLSWLWQVGNHWSGEATYRRSRSLGGFADFRQNVRDLVDNEAYFVSAGYRFHPRWRIGVDASEVESTHSAAIRRPLDYNSHALGAELRYRTPADNTVALQARRIDINYPNRVLGPFSTNDSGNQETRVNVVGLWQLSGLTRLEGQVGHVDVRYHNLEQRDFSGNTWRAGAVWESSAKLRVSANVFKDVRLYEDVATSYIVVNGVSVSPVYSITPKIILQADLSYEKRDFRGDPGFFLVSENREDKAKLARLGLIYSPIRNVDLSLSYEIGNRRSNAESLAFIDGALRRIKINDYDYQSWFASLRVGF